LRNTRGDDRDRNALRLALCPCVTLASQSASSMRVSPHQSETSMYIMKREVQPSLFHRRTYAPFKYLSVLADGRKGEAHAAIDAAGNSIAPRKMRIQKAGVVFRAISAHFHQSRNHQGFDVINMRARRGKSLDLGSLNSKHPRYKAGSMGKRLSTAPGLHLLLIV